jgi:phosphatidylserine synthase
MTVLGTVVMLAMGYLMVSTIEFFSIKQFKLAGVKLKGRLLIGSLIALIWYSPPIGLLALAFLYVASGPYGKVADSLPSWLVGRRPARRDTEGKVVSLK